MGLFHSQKRAMQIPGFCIFGTRETWLLQIPFNKTELMRKTLQLLHSYSLCIWSYQVCIEVINYKAYASASNDDQNLFQFLSPILAMFRNPPYKIHVHKYIEKRRKVRHIAEHQVSFWVLKLP